MAGVARPAARPPGDVFLPAGGAPGTPAAGGQGKILGLDRRVAIGVGVVAAVILAYFLYKRYSSSSSSSSGQATDPSQNTIDPATGYPYGSPEDLAALAASQPQPASGGGSGAPTGDSGSGSNQGEVGDLLGIIGTLLASNPSTNGQTSQQSAQPSNTFNITEPNITEGNVTVNPPNITEPDITVNVLPAKVPLTPAATKPPSGGGTPVDTTSSDYGVGGGTQAGLAANVAYAATPAGATNVAAVVSHPASAGSSGAAQSLTSAAAKAPVPNYQAIRNARAG